MPEAPKMRPAVPQAGDVVAESRGQEPPAKGLADERRAVRAGVFPSSKTTPSGREESEDGNEALLEGGGDASGDSFQT